MPTLKNACDELQQTLSQVESDCHIILHSLDEFEVYASTFLVNRLLNKFGILAQLILRETKRLYTEHHGNGYVCVFFTERNGINILWIEDEKIVADKKRMASYGSIVASPEVAIESMRQMIMSLESNQWPEVVQFLAKYGKSPGVDFS